MSFLRRLTLRRYYEIEAEDDELGLGEPEVRSVLVIARNDAIPFYHSMTDEDFCEWARSWSSGPQVLSSEVRDEVMERLREDHPAWGHMDV